MSDSKKPSRPEIEKLIEGNPKVDRGQLREAQEALKRLEREGVSPPGYSIDSPYQSGPAGRRVDRATRSK